MNYSEIRASIVTDHLWRTDIPDATVHEHLLAAQEFVQSQRRWQFLDNLNASVSSGAASFSLPPGSATPLRINSLLVNTNGSLLNVERRPRSTLRELFAATTTGTPRYYDFFQSQFFVAPTPDRTYTYEVWFSGRLARPAITDTTATNYLTDNAPLALIYRASETLARGLLHDDNAAQRYANLFAQELAVLEEADDALAGTFSDGNMQPDTLIYDAAFGARSIL